MGIKRLTLLVRLELTIRPRGRPKKVPEAIVFGMLCRKALNLPEAFKFEAKLV